MNAYIKKTTRNQTKYINWEGWGYLIKVKNAAILKKCEWILVTIKS